MGTKPVWEMIKEAVMAFDGNVVSYKEIKDYIFKNYGDVNSRTINCQIVVCSVNQPSRIHYPENSKPRRADGENRYDFLYNVERGKVELFDPSIHGVWEIAQDENGLVVKKIGDDDYQDKDNDDKSEVDEQDFMFKFESHLRDFIALNLSLVDSNLELYTSDDGVVGVEYRTPIGNIDILAQDKNGEFIVFELKLGRGPDATLGQLLRYMGWIKRNLSKDKTVRGVIVAKSICDKLKYATSVVENVSLFEYSVQFDIYKVGLSK